jgi:hypothetical protein
MFSVKDFTIHVCYEYNEEMFTAQLGGKEVKAITLEELFHKLLKLVTRLERECLMEDSD